VILPGYIAQPATWLEAMDIFLLSSFSEGTSMTLLEAMSLGKPCVGTAVGGNPEIIHDGSTGYLTPNKDPSAFAAATLRLIENKSVYVDMAELAVESFEQSFTSTTMSHHYNDCYNIGSSSKKV
jgi:glycosyltransferase involved in cell wall biosynthesis